ncbi:TadE/TadG family type IV pilus assembly protein [Parerythrobacter lacustris]|uniref:Pilus assembly protein n=1 Tax=Parerythrobacter lacustris TaxID=2969984 RepID=A0ABT1XQ38_9SPHN|nr:TadE family protein [Parerythrobacter lacustris]MCR2833785.1 pilus assembly protein [Parerythrobacter lacustris]
MTEFAFVLPVLLVMGLYGAEIARMAMTRTQISQIALSVADNASRLGQTDNSGVTPTITETDVDAILDGAIRQGNTIDLEENGRIILSSLEYDGFSERQYIHWQRCRGDAEIDSEYGDDGANSGLTGDVLTGMGSGSSKATASPGTAVMFVEIEYTYSALFENPFGSGDQTLRSEAAFLIRDDRNLTPGLTGGSSNSECD